MTRAYAGQEGSKVTSRQILERLSREAEGNVAIKIAIASDKDAYQVSGRGELQLSVLIEQMRREGFELCVGRPRVLYQTDESGQRLEPIEEVVIDVDEEYSGIVVEKLSLRAAPSSRTCARPAPASSASSSTRRRAR